MRKGSNGAIITADGVAEINGSSGGQVIGINFGADFTAEHEGGITEIKHSFGIPGVTQCHGGVSSIVGLDARTVTTVPNSLEFFEDIDGHAYLICTNSPGSLQEGGLVSAKYLDRMIEADDGEELSTAWDAETFGVRMKNDALNLGTMVLGQIYEAIMNHDAVICLGGAQVFGNNGLNILIRSRISVKDTDRLKEDDEDYLNLLATAESTGIVARLKAADLGYFALSPRWAPKAKPGEECQFKTEHSVIFWLNPMKQRMNNFGWFTVEDLLAWIDGEGPIPMQNKKESQTA